MINGKLIYFAILIICLLAISNVSASEIDTNFHINADDLTLDDGEMDNENLKRTDFQLDEMDNDDEVNNIEGNNLNSSFNSDILTENNPNGTFSELSALIESTEVNGTLVLEKSYVYENGLSSGIKINKAIIIDGQNHTLDGNHLSRIFYVSASDVVLKNIKFANAKIEDDGGAIKWYGNSGQLINSTFVNCSIYHSKTSNLVFGGGAIYWHGDNGTVSHC